MGSEQVRQAQKMAKDWKFWIEKVEEFYYPCSENKGADQLRSYCEADLRVTAKLICVFVFAYADCWFSHEVAQIQMNCQLYTVDNYVTKIDYCVLVFGLTH